MTNQPDESSTSGDDLGSEKHREKWDNVADLADLVYTDVANATVHMKFLLEALEELWQ